MSLGPQPPFQPQSTGTFGGFGSNSFGGMSGPSSTGFSNQQFGSTSTFSTGGGYSAPSSDIFSTMQTAPSYGAKPSSTQATQGSWGSSQASSSSAPKKAADDGFGAFQSSEKDAWSMGHGLGKL